MNNIILPQDNKFVKKIMFARFWWWAWYLEYQKSKKTAEAIANNEANKIKIAWEIEEKLIREKIQIIDSLEQADKFIEYKNLYEVLTKAVPKITYMGNDERIDPDKTKRLKDLSKEFSSEEMQEYIAWILAWEYNQPWTYSLKTMSVIKNLTKQEIEIFRKFCWLVIDWNFILRDFYLSWHKNLIILSSKWIWYNEYLYLKELWLISSSLSVSDYEIGIYKFFIGKKILNLQLDKKTTISKSFLTKAWTELYKLIKPIFDEELFNICKEDLIKFGFEEKI